MHPSLYAV